MNNIELEIKRQIESNKNLNDFLDGKISRLIVVVEGVPVIIGRGDEYADFQYQLPFSAEYDYKKVVNFLQYASPILSKMLSERELHNL